MNNQIITIGEDVQPIIEWLEFKSNIKIFILTGRNSFNFSGAKKYLQPILSKYNHILFSDFTENPQIEDVYKGIELFNNENCNCCIAVGGGTVLDMGKLICYLKDEQLITQDLFLKKKTENIKRNVPFCAIPTTSGSGSESTNFAVLYHNKNKYSISHQTILPDIVNLNPKLSYTLPSYLKAIAGIDALSQGIESYWSKNATRKSRKYSTDAIKFVWNNLKLSVLENDFTAHGKVVKGSNLAGKAINITKTTAPHALSYYFTSEHGIKHGHAVALTLGKVFQFNYENAKNSNNKIKQIFNELNGLLLIKDNPQIVIEKFILELNIELDYSRLGIDVKKELPIMKTRVNRERLKNNPIHISENDYEKLII